MNPSSELLATCIDGVREGRLSIEECTRLYPAQATELGSLLQVSSSVFSPPAAALDPIAKARGRAALLAAMAPDRLAGPKPVSDRFPGSLFAALGWPPSHRGSLARLPAYLVAFVLACTAMVSGGAIVASGAALPGDVLYPIKLTIAEVQLATARSPRARGEIALHQATDRLAEMELAVEKGRPDAVTTASAEYVASVAIAGQELANATSSGADAGSLSSTLESQLERQRATIELVATSAPLSERAALAAAADAASDEAYAHRGTDVRTVAGGSSIAFTQTPTATVTPATPPSAPTQRPAAIQVEPTQTEVSPRRSTATPGVAPPLPSATREPSSAPDETIGDDEGHTVTAVATVLAVPTGMTAPSTTPIPSITPLPSPTTESSGATEDLGGNRGHETPTVAPAVTPFPVATSIQVPTSEATLSPVPTATARPSSTLVPSAPSPTRTPVPPEGTHPAGSPILTPAGSILPTPQPTLAPPIKPTVVSALPSPIPQPTSAAGSDQGSSGSD